MYIHSFNHSSFIDLMSRSKNSKFPLWGFLKDERGHVFKSLEDLKDAFVNPDRADPQQQSQHVMDHFTISVRSERALSESVPKSQLLTPKLFYTIMNFLVIWLKYNDCINDLEPGMIFPGL